MFNLSNVTNKNKQNDHCLRAYVTFVCLNPTCILFPVSLLCIVGFIQHLICKRYRSYKYIQALFERLCKHIRKTNVTSRLRLLARPILVWCSRMSSLLWTNSWIPCVFVLCMYTAPLNFTFILRHT